MNYINQFEHLGYTIEIGYDSYADSPRENYNIATIACWHPRYNLGDEQISHMTEEEMRESYDIADILPVYIYDHGGITVNTTGFSCGWDSGQVGWIFITNDVVKRDKLENYNLKDIMVNEVSGYDQYLRGDVYQFLVKDSEGNVVESCADFYDLTDCEREAISIVDYLSRKAS